jgi:hypothetical protein
MWWLPLCAEYACFQPARPLLLRAALGGGSNEVSSGCNTLMLGCISPLALHLANTKSTLE